MKRTRIYESICIIIILIVIIKTAFGQWHELEVETYTETYSDIENAEYIQFHPNLALNSTMISLGFSINAALNVDKQAPDSVKVNFDGSITLSEKPNGNQEIIYAYGIDFIYRFAGTGELHSTISYTLEGHPGKRILKIQWQNMGFKKEYDIFGTTDSYTNVQLWIYESEPTIEVRVGPTYSPYNQAPQPIFEYGPQIGYYAVFWDQYQNPTLVKRLLSGPPADPEIGYDWFLDEMPEENTVYRFYTERVITSVNNKQSNTNKIKVYPNPVVESATIEYTTEEPSRIRLAVYGMDGRQVFALVDGHQAAGKHKVKLDAIQLAAGNYIGVLSTEKGTRKTKILVTK